MIKLSQKHFKIRTTLIIAPIVTLFLLFFDYSLIKDYLIHKESLNKATFIIDSFQDQVWVEKRLFKPDIINKCLDIKTKEPSHIIRLSDELFSNKWSIIQKRYSVGDTLVVLFKNRLLKNDTLYNPYEIKINKNTLISYEDNRRNNLYFVLLISFLILLFSFLSLIAYNTYKTKLLYNDKILYKKNKWKLIGRWLWE